MQNPFYAPYGNDNNCCGDAGDCTGPCPADGWNNPAYAGPNGYTPGFQACNTPNYTGFNPGFNGYTPGFQGCNTPNYTGFNPGFNGYTPGFQGWNSPNYTGFNPGFNGEHTPGLNTTGSTQPAGYGFNDFANVPASNPGTGSGTTGTTPTTNTGHPGMNWTGGYATNAA